MKPREKEKRPQKTPQIRGAAPKPKLQIVKLEERIAPKLATNHNETLVRGPAKAAPVRKKAPKLQIVKLEERIAPKIATNHNESLGRGPARAKPKAPAPRKVAPKSKLQIVKLEERIAPGMEMQHNETLVRDR